ncbi:hypothetical protein BO94DRAFT_312397 [Aspergillus sclerotioniger CBS 115572]|uniref:Uncharacterized protein n=1 Tax=Aspergillus sclerotioniger CBS 115572 TaxID=1450535 RepID=A0A317XAD7_9EURO|nr:hypothetical protein BO94DRAFT_312397 [Aspergillus sclerotioniger CBS 115572]PWY93898.1 hypothetical protein BO94DRAFT_312397 [Aspergillus sclerotioniger CBS 115572]
MQRLRARPSRDGASPGCSPACCLHCLLLLLDSSHSPLQWLRIAATVLCISRLHTPSLLCSLMQWLDVEKYLIRGLQHYTENQALFASDL